MIYRTMMQIVTVLALSLAFIVPSQAALSPGDEASIEQVKKETRDLLKTIKSYGAEQRDEAIQEIEIAIIKLDNRIDSLQSRIDNEWDEMTAPARQQARESLNLLQQQRVELAEWYGGLKGSSADAWAEIRRGFSKAYSDINRAWEKALNDFSADKS